MKVNDDGHECGTWNVMRPSQHGEEPKVIESGFSSQENASEWIDRHTETWKYLPYPEEVA
jgi:hypothetical protein